MGLALPLEAVVKKDGDVFVLEIDESLQIIFRLPPLKRAMQYAHILSIAESIDLQFIVYDYIFRDAVDSSFITNNDSLPAGLAETVARLVLYLSGVDDQFINYTGYLLEFNRDSTSSVLSIMKRTICSVFAGYKFSDLDLLNYQELVHVFVQAEKCLLEQGIITEGLVLKNPQEEEAKAPTIGQMIEQDSSDYREFDLEGARRVMRQDPAQRAREEEAKFREQVLSRYKRKGG